MLARYAARGLRPGPRSVYICVPESANPRMGERVQQVLGSLIRGGDRLIYANRTAAVDPVIRFAERHGVMADPISGEQTAPDLILVLIDPLHDSASALEARALAPEGDSNLVIAELPDLDD